MLRIADSFAGSDTGRQRRGNEDAYLERAPVFVVADGMGGARAGEVASRVAVEAYAAADLGGGGEGALADRARQANAQIHALSEREADLQGMGTTLTATLVTGDEVAIAHVGDSRAYLLRDGALSSLTDDHSLVGELMRQGRLSREEASGHPQRSIITRALGPEADVQVDTRTVRGQPGDVFLLCSDGLTSMVDEEDIARILLSSPDLARAGRTLIAAANEAGGADNITVVLFSLDGAPEAAGGLGPDTEPLEQPTSAMPALPADGGTLPAADAPPPSRRLPRMPAAPPPSRRRRRVPLAPLAVLFVVALVAVGAWIASQSVYFVGTNRQGLVTVYRGLPYDLPVGLHLYTANYVSGVSVESLAPGRRRSLLDHKLRSHDDAASLVRDLELGRLAG